MRICITLRFSVLIMSMAFALAGAARAAVDFPTRPVRLVLSFAAGNSGEAYWRGLANLLSKAWDQPVIIDYKPGAGGVIAAQNVANSVPDGYTLFGTGTSLVGLGLFTKLNFDPITDIRIVAIAAISDAVFVTNGQLPIKNLAEFVAYAKANPGKLNYASLGKNSVMMYLEWFKRATGMQLVEVPFKGTAAQIEALMRNDVHLMYMQAQPLKPYFDSGRLRPLFIVSKDRLPNMPDIPTNAEVGLPDFTPPQWNAVGISAKVPEELFQKIRTDVIAVLTSHEMEPFAAAVSNRPYRGTAKQGEEYFNYTVKLMRDLAKELNIKPE